MYSDFEVGDVDLFDGERELVIQNAKHHSNSGQNGAKSVRVGVVELERHMKLQEGEHSAAGGNPNQKQHGGIRH